MRFADRLTQRAERLESSLCVGFDPVIENLPEVFIKEADIALSNEESLFRVLRAHHNFALGCIEPFVCCIKPNVAFYEQYGFGGLRALSYLLHEAKDRGIPTILDVKRGDIGSTAQAYSKAYLDPIKLSGSEVADFEADAITVNPFLGFETIQVFLDAALSRDKGVFILVRTSNPGSSDLQCRMIRGINATDPDQRLCDVVARWISENSGSLSGTLGVSGLGAVIGATHGSEISRFRSLMPQSIFLIPGVGAQGATADDVVAAYITPHRGAVINVSRGILGAYQDLKADRETLEEEVTKLASGYKQELLAAQKVHSRGSH